MCRMIILHSQNNHCESQKHSTWNENDEPQRKDEMFMNPQRIVRDGDGSKREFTMTGAKSKNFQENDNKDNNEQDLLPLSSKLQHNSNTCSESSTNLTSNEEMREEKKKERNGMRNNVDKKEKMRLPGNIKSKKRLFQLVRCEGGKKSFDARKIKGKDIVERIQKEVSLEHQRGIRLF